MSDQEKSKSQLLEEIAALRQRNAELESAENELHLLRGVIANAAGQVIWATTPDSSRVLLFNPPAEEVAGYKKEDFLNNPMHWFDIVHPDDRERIIESMATLWAEGRRDIEYRIVRPDGSVRWFTDPAALIYDDKREVVAIAGMALDITEQKEAEEFARLQRDLAVAAGSASNLEDALEICVNLTMKTSDAERVGIYLVNEDTSLDLASGKGMPDTFREKVSHFPAGSQQAKMVQMGRPAYVKVSETEGAIHDLAAAEGLKSLGIIPILYRERPVAVIVIGFTTTAEVPDTVRHRIEAIGSNLGGMIVRLEAEKKHRESESSMRAMLDAISESAFLVDADHKVLVANETTARRLGMTVEQLVGISLKDIVAPDVIARRQADVDRVIETKQFVQSIDSRDEYIFDYCIYPVFDEKGEVSLLAVFAKDITEQQRAAEKIALEQKLLRELFELQERDRTLVSHEIHDGVVQDIVAAKMFMNVLCAQLKSCHCELPGETKKVEERLDHAIAEARRLIRELRPLIVDDEGVIRAIDHLVVQEREFTEMRIEFDHDVALDRLEPMLEGNIYRIVQEAARNARRHSRAKRVKISIVQNNGWITITVSDDGIGFNPESISGDRFGVRGIRERARLFGGNACIDSKPGAGTNILVQLPIELTAEMMERGVGSEERENE